MKTLSNFLVAFLVCNSSLALAGGQERPHYELLTSLSYDASTGKVSSTPTDSGTTLNETRLGARLGCGFILSDTAEPVMELNYQNKKRKVADFKSSETSIGYGLGVLFNMPMGIAKDRKSKKRDLDDQDGEPIAKSDFTNATWIPYLGFILNKKTDTESRGATNSTKVSDGDLITKLVIGTRWMVYERVSMNFSLRASYQKSTSTATDGAQVGGSVSKMEIEGRFLELSLFL